MATAVSQQHGRAPQATPDDIRSAFTRDFDFLYWVALVITGDSILAKRSLVRASELSGNERPLFRDWLLHWARTATAQRAIGEVQGHIVSAGARYLNATCSHRTHELLNEEQIDSLGRIEPFSIISELDPLARAALVLRGIQHCSILDCAISLNTPAKCVLSAYCHALNWIGEREVVLR
jgi:hypothetical protein